MAIIMAPYKLSQSDNYGAIIVTLVTIMEPPSWMQLLMGVRRVASKFLIGLPERGYLS